MIASMAYVNLNPVRAKIAQSLEQCQNTSIEARLRQLENSADRLLEAVGSLVAGIGDAVRRIPITLGNYIRVLRETIQADSSMTDPAEPSKTSVWLARIRAIGKQQRAQGSAEKLREWFEARGRRQPRICLPR